MKTMIKLLLTSVGSFATLTILQTSPSQAALLNYNLKFVENITSNTGEGTFQIDDANNIGAGYFQVTDFQVTTPQGEFFTLADYTPSTPTFSFGYNPTLGFAGVGDNGQLIFSPFIGKGVGNFLFFERFSNSYTEDLYFPSETSGVYTATQVPEPITILGIGTVLGFGTFFKRQLSKTSKKV